MVMKTQRKREDMWARVCARGEVNGQGEGRGCTGRNSTLPVTVLRIAVHSVFASDTALDNFPTFYYEKFQTYSDVE